MNSLCLLSKISNEACVQLIVEKDGSSNHLPPEVFEEIFSYLSIKDMGSITLTSKFFNILLINSLKRESFLQIMSLKKFFSEKLDQKLYASQLADLYSFEKDVKILDCVSLREVKSTTDKVEKKTAMFLKDLKEENLKSLEELFKGTKKAHYLFKNTFFLADTYKEMESFVTKVGMTEIVLLKISSGL